MDDVAFFVALVLSAVCVLIGLRFFVAIFTAAWHYNQLYKTVSPEDFLRAVAAMPGTIVFCKHGHRICTTYVQGFYLDTESAEPLELPAGCVCLPRDG